MVEITKEDLDKEIELNHTAKTVLDLLDDMQVDEDTKAKIELIAETIMEDTAGKILSYKKVVDNN